MIWKKNHFILLSCNKRLILYNDERNNYSTNIQGSVSISKVFYKEGIPPPSPEDCDIESILGKITENIQ